MSNPFKSKTINMNALYMALVAVSSALGIELGPELIAAGQTILNIVMRYITKEPMAAK
jgi:hypothetical protein